MDIQRVGWGPGQKYWHLVILVLKQERVACGARVALIAGRHPKALGERCSRCVAFEERNKFNFGRSG